MVISEQLFQIHLMIWMVESNHKIYVQVLNDMVNEYFVNTFGHSEMIHDKNLENKCKDWTVKEMKKALWNFK